MEAEFKRQTSNYRPRAQFRRGAKITFLRKLVNENRAMVWVHKNRHEEIARLAEATGMTMSAVTDALIRYALANTAIINDSGEDVDLKQYLDALLGIQQVTDETIKDLQDHREESVVILEGVE